MRIGNNPAKADPTLHRKAYHRIIVPVYIPNLEGYFADALSVMKVSLDTLLHTCHSSSEISVVDNGCCDEVRAVLRDYFERGAIDQLVHNRENLGKIDALNAVIRGSYEPLITIADADVLFVPGWIEEVERAYAVFPEIGLVSPCPNPLLWRYASASTLTHALLSFSGRSGGVVDPDELLQFARSVHRESDYEGDNALWLKRQLCLERDGLRVLIGAGHFAATLRRSVFNKAPNRPSLRKITGGSEHEYIDDPVDRSGLLRVSTSKVLVHHMGNQIEPWMLVKRDEIIRSAPRSAAAQFEHGVSPSKRALGSGWLPYGVRKVLVRALGVRYLARLYLRTWFGVPLRLDRDVQASAAYAPVKNEH